MLPLSRTKLWRSDTSNDDMLPSCLMSKSSALILRILSLIWIRRMLSLPIGRMLSILQMAISCCRSRLSIMRESRNAFENLIISSLETVMSPLSTLAMNSANFCAVSDVPALLCTAICSTVSWNCIKSCRLIRAQQKLWFMQGCSKILFTVELRYKAPSILRKP